MTYPFAAASFDFISAVAALHHLPLEPALARLRSLLAPGGVLAVIGLYRPETASDYALAAAAAPASWMMKRLRQESTQAAAMKARQETLADIQAAARDLLPGAVLERRLFFRYSLLWRK